MTLQTFTSPNMPNRSAAGRELETLRRRNNGLDFSSLTSASGVTGYQEPLPDLDLQWLWQTDTQAGFALTIASQRGGLNMQRDKVEKSHSRQAESDLISHARDEIILPFAYEQQVNHQAVFTNGNIIHCDFEDRHIMLPFLGTETGNDLILYAETSPTDPTITAIAIPPSPYGGTVGASVGYPLSLGTARYEGVEYLLLHTSRGHLVISTLDPITAAFCSNHRVVSSPTVAATTISIAPGLGGSVIGPALATWNPAAAGVEIEQIIGYSFVQSPLPGDPLIVRGVNTVALIPTVSPPNAPSNPFNWPGSIMLRNVGLGNSQALGFLAAGGRQPRCYWWETNNGGPATNGSFSSRLTSLNAYGYDYQVHGLSITRITGCAASQQRGGIALTDGYRAIFWQGRETDMGLFSDEAPNETHILYCVGVYEKDGQVYAEINELPKADAANANGASIGQGRVRACKRRYDFDLERWHQISEWLTLTEDGLIRWNNGVPIPVATAAHASIGFMSAYGAPDLPFGDVTRAMHNHFVPARYNAALTAALPLPQTFEATWTNKFEPPAAQNPYSFRGGDKAFATSGTSRTPGLIFNGESRYANKYIDEVDFGGNDTGGTSSSVTVRIGEYGHLDDVDSAANRPLLEHTFENGMSHDQRRRRFGSNRTAFMIPQVEIEITGGSDNTLTPQALPITLYGHIDFPEHPRREVQDAAGRSKA